MAAWRNAEQRAQYQGTPVYTGQPSADNPDDSYDWSDNEFDDDDPDDVPEVSEEYLNSEDIKYWREEKERQSLGVHHCRVNVSQGNGVSSSMPVIPTIHSDSDFQQPQCQARMTKKKRPIPPPQANKPRPSNSYLELWASEDSDPQSPPAADVSGRRQHHSDNEFLRVPQSSSHAYQQHQQQRVQFIDARPKNDKMASLPVNARHATASRSPAYLRSAAAGIDVRRPDEDEPPTEQAPPPPSRCPVRKNENRINWGAAGGSRDQSSSGRGSSGTPPPRSPASNKGREKSQPSKTQKTAEEVLSRFSWYKAFMSREEAIQKVREYRVEGSFVVRSSRQAGPNKPFVMTILCRKEIFHVPIRRRTSDSFYAVGEDKPDELRFETVEDVIKHFHLNPIDLVMTDSKKRNEKYRVALKYHE